MLSRVTVGCMVGLSFSCAMAPEPIAFEIEPWLCEAEPGFGVEQSYPSGTVGSAQMFVRFLDLEHHEKWAPTEMLFIARRTGIAAALISVVPDQARRAIFVVASLHDENREEQSITLAGPLEVSDRIGLEIRWEHKRVSFRTDRSDRVATFTVPFEPERIAIGCSTGRMAFERIAGFTQRE